jgi:hypothetical protein
MEWEFIIKIITIVGFFVTIVTICFAFYQLNQEKRFKKLNHFTELRSRFKTNNHFTEIRERLNNHQNLDSISIINLYDYAGFFEELQIAINAKFIKPKMVYYLFGHYILDFADNQNIIQLEAPLWSALNELVITMRSIDENYIYTNTLKF